VFGRSHKAISVAALTFGMMASGHAWADDIVSALRGRTVIFDYLFDKTSHNSALRLRYVESIRFDGKRINYKVIQGGQEGDSNPYRPKDNGSWYVPYARINTQTDPKNKPSAKLKGLKVNYSYLTHGADGNTMTFSYDYSTVLDVGKNDDFWEYYVNKSVGRRSVAIEFSDDLKKCKMVRYVDEENRHSRHSTRMQNDPVDETSSETSRLVSSKCTVK